MGLGFIKNILKKRQVDKGSHSGMLEPHGSIKMQIPITFTITQHELDQYGFTPSEQMVNNPRIRDKINRVI